MPVRVVVVVDDGDSSFEYLPLTRDATFLMELRSMNEEHIVCCAVSPDALWIAYADRNQLRLFRFYLVNNADTIAAAASAVAVATAGWKSFSVIQLKGD